MEKIFKVPCMECFWTMLVNPPCPPEFNIEYIIPHRPIFFCRLALSPTLNPGWKGRGKYNEAKRKTPVGFYFEYFLHVTPTMVVSPERTATTSSLQISIISQDGIKRPSLFAPTKTTTNGRSVSYDHHCTVVFATTDLPKCIFWENHFPSVLTPKQF